jgi:hypothetical protein
MAWGEDPPPAADAAKKARPSGRLPKYYAAVVNQVQREEIYRIQEEYEPKIKALQAQLDAMKKEKDQKIESVLTPEQKKKIEEAGIAAVKRKLEEKEQTAEAAPKPTDGKSGEKADDPTENTKKKPEKTKKKVGN